MAWVGVDLGGTNIYTVVTGGDGEVVGRAKLRTPTTGDRLGVVDVLEAAVLTAVDDAGASLADMAGVGVGTPGMVMGGTVGGASNVPGWSERFSLAEMFQERVNLPVRLANDVTAAAVGEHRWGAAKGCDNALVVFSGTGVGAGLILSGEPYEGGRGGAGEFGHTVVVRGGATCPCGRQGCVEAYAGRRAMVLAAKRAVEHGRETVLFDLMRDMGQTRVTSGVFKAALDAGDELVAELLGDAVKAMGAGIASAVNLLDVDIVVMGGGLADRLGDWYRHRIEAAMRSHLFLYPPTVAMRPATLGDEAGAIGAAALAADSDGDGRTIIA